MENPTEVATVFAPDMMKDKLIHVPEMRGSVRVITKEPIVEDPAEKNICLSCE